MTPIWHDGPLESLAWDGVCAVAWSVVQTGLGDVRQDRLRLASGLIGRLAGSPADRVRLERSPAGAPIVVTPAGWHLGLSNRGSRCLIGVATAPIAVDRELLDPAAPLWDMLSDGEARDLRRIDAAAQPREWLRRWTIKEAHAKLIGEPRRIAPEEIETTVIDAVHATARFEGISRCWTRLAGAAIETIAQWSDTAGANAR